MGVIIRMGIDTSARRGEILKMEWHWLDLDSGTAFFPAHITKTKIERTVPLIERLRTSLRHHKEKVTEQLGKPPAGRVFPYTPDGFNANWTRIRQRARKEYEALRKADGVTDEELKSDDTVTGFRMHDCRHEATSRMMSAGLNIHDVKSVTGHSDLRSLSRYTHGNLAIAIKAVLDKHIKATTKKQKRLP